MKKLLASVALVSAVALMSSCGTVLVDNAVYDPGYSNDYVYSVGYYNNRPYWGNNYYYYSGGAPWGVDGYWGGSYYLNGY